MLLNNLEDSLKKLDLKQIKEVKALVDKYYKERKKKVTSKRLVDTYTNKFGIYFRLEKVFCNKDNCSKCQEGEGHGPYWYSYKNGSRSYIGKKGKDDLDKVEPFSKPALKNKDNRLPYKL